MKPFRFLNALSPYRLHDWIAVLGLVRDKQTRYLSYRGAWRNEKDHLAVKKTSNWANGLQLPFGAVYVAVAVKETHIRPMVELPIARDRKIDPITIPRPTARQ